MAFDEMVLYVSGQGYSTFAQAVALLSLLVDNILRSLLSDNLPLSLHFTLCC